MLSLRHCVRLVNNRPVGLKVTRHLSSESQLVNVSVDDKTGTATVALNRPPVNSLNLELLQSFGQTVDDLEKNKCRGMILTSTSSTVFSAGLDIMEMYKPKPDRVKDFWTTLQNSWLKLYMATFPTVAAINGHSPAGGCLLALSCDYRVMVGPKFTIGLNETKLGIIAPVWFQSSMRNVIGQRQTELALTSGKMFSTDEALKCGLVDELATDTADCIGKAEKFLGIFANIPNTARVLTKLELREPYAKWLQENREADLNRFLNFINQPAVQKGLELYLQSLKKK